MRARWPRYRGTQRARSADGGQPERADGGSRSGRGGAQRAGAAVRRAAHRGDHLREPAGVSQRVHREGAEDHHQLLHRQPRGGRPDARGARAAALRLLRGEVIVQVTCLYLKDPGINTKHLLLY